MKFDETTWLLIYSVSLLVSLAIMYLIIKLAVKDALKESGALGVKEDDGSASHLIDMIEKQNVLLSLLVAKEMGDQGIALIRPGNGETKIVKAEELNKHPLQEYDVQIIQKAY